MTIHRYEVTDAEWAIIEPMLPKHHIGRPQKDLRSHFNGILWIARSGARWEDLPARYGPHQTVYSCFCRIRPYTAVSVAGVMMVRWNVSFINWVRMQNLKS